MVVIVVPSFAEGQQCNPPVVAAVVRSFESTVSEEVADGVHAESYVVNGNGAQYEAPDESGRATEVPATHSEKGTGNPVKPVEPFEFGEFLPVFHLIPVGVAVTSIDDPANVRPEDRLLDG